MHKLGGVFILLAIGITIALLTAVLEFYLQKRKAHRKTKNRVSSSKYCQTSCVMVILSDELCHANTCLNAIDVI